MFYTYKDVSNEFGIDQVETEESVVHLRRWKFGRQMWMKRKKTKV
jgi:hypothetical protein